MKIKKDIKKLAPWNWFKKEQEQEEKSIQIRKSETPRTVSHPLFQIQNEINRLFDDVFHSVGFPSWNFDRALAPLIQTDWLKPMLDISAADKEYSITVEIPGVDEKDIKLELIDDTLTISGEKKQEKEEKEKNYYRMERSYGSFHRVLSLPEDADRDNIQASYKNGIMKISVPRKALPQPETKRIEIRAE
jgi:HSP20 family protein